MHSFSSIAKEDFHFFVDNIKKMKTEELPTLLFNEQKTYTKNPTKYNRNKIILIKAIIQRRNNNIYNYVHLLIKILESKPDNYDQEVWIRIALSQTLKSLNSPELSLEFLLPITEDLYKHLDSLERIKVQEMIAMNYYSLKNYKKAVGYFRNVYDLYPNSNELNRSSMINNIALCYLNQKQYTKSLHYFIQSLDIIEKVEQKNDSQLFLKYLLLGNIGMVNNKLKKYDVAENYLMKEMEFYFSNEEKYYSNIQNTLSELLKLYSTTNSKTKAISLINKCENALTNIESDLKKSSNKPFIFKDIYEYFLKINDSKAAFKYSRILIPLQEKYEEKMQETTTSLTKTIHQSKLDNLNSKVKMEQYKFKLITEKNKKTYWILSVIIGFVFIFFLILFLIIIQRKRQAEKDSIIMSQKIEIETNRSKILHNEILVNQEKITKLSQNIQLKKETEKAFLNKINEIKKDKTKDPERAIKELQISISSLLSINKQPIENSDLQTIKFKRLLKRLPQNLTKLEIELCVFFNMELSAKDIAALKDMSPGSVRVYKSKIKSKLSIEKEQSLSEYLKKLSI